MNKRFNKNEFFEKIWRERTQFIITMKILNPIKNKGVELAFTRGKELSNIQGVLNSHGRNQVFGIRYHNVEEISSELLSEIIQEALLLDESVPYQSPGRIK